MVTVAETNLRRHAESIAALMGKTASFSKSQLARGTRRLREMLKITQEKYPDLQFHFTSEFKMEAVH